LGCWVCGVPGRPNQFPEGPCRESVVKGIPKYVFGQVVFGGAWSTKAKKHTFSRNEWFLGRGTPGLPKKTWPRNHFGIPLKIFVCFSWPKAWYVQDASYGILPEIFRPRRHPSHTFVALHRCAAPIIGPSGGFWPSTASPQIGADAVNRAY
jgi:hypothetical protein